MKKLPIGIIDMNNDNIIILNQLRQDFKHETLIYINDLKQYEYEGLTIEAINERVKNNIEFLLSFEIKLLIVASSTIIEYCHEYLKQLSIPVISIIDTICDYVNDKYEHKNIAFLANKHILEANLYQKRFRYNHLYNLPSDSLNNIINEKKMKTSFSFSTTKEILRSVLKKDIDVIVPSNANILLLKTEINEFMPFIPIVHISEIISKKVNEVLGDDRYHKGRGKTFIYINVSKNKSNINHLLSIKYKVKVIRGE